MKRLFWGILLAALLHVNPALSQSLVSEYKSYSSLTGELKKLAAQFPDIIHLQSLGQTVQKRDLWLTTLGADAATQKPALFIAGGLEGPDVASSDVCLRFLKNMALQYGRVDSITELLRRVDFYVAPRVNPDASEQLWRPLKYDRFLNARSLDLDHDGAVDEDGYDDMNGDGLISLMRVSNPSGQWMADPLDSQLVRKADPAQHQVGVYKIMPEGRDNDGDGRWNEDEAGGVDVNRNFSYRYKFFQSGAGDYPVSEVESRAVADFLFEHENIVVVFSFSTASNLLTPWESRKSEQNRVIDAVLPQDAPYFKFVAEQYKNIFGDAGSEASPPPPGDLCEWAYYHYGRWSFNAPVWTPPEIQCKDSTKTAPEKDVLAGQRKLLHWLQHEHVENAVVAWQKIDHPDFPDATVEVGGFAPGVKYNPPADSIDAVGKRYMRFFQQLADDVPTLDVQVTVDARDKGLYGITAAVKNSGYLPTNSRLGAQSQWVKKVKTELVASEQVAIISGTRFYFSDQINGGSAVELTWLVAGKEGQTVTIKTASPGAGFAEKTVALK